MMDRERRRVVAWALAACLSGFAGMAAEDILIADFEGQNYGGWIATGEAFGPGPARGTLPNQMPVSGFRGQGLVNSYVAGDGSVGTLTSPTFLIQRSVISFLIGGGQSPGMTCMNLLVAGEAVRTATGPNDRPGGSERLHWQCWVVSEFLGREAQIQIVDQRREGWGHVNVDHILQGSECMAKEMKMEIPIQKTTLNLPVQNGAPKRRMRFLLDGKIAREFEIELAEGDPSFWVFSDVSPWRGQTLTVWVDDLEENPKALSGIVQSDSDSIRGGEDLYRETYRPQFHFSSRRGWNNDPNGLVYHQGEYHLFYQHNPYGWKWDNMHWGHAVSPDLVHWQELPIALYPQAFGDWCFSGSAVVDPQNTAGFKTGQEDVLVAAYTSTGRGECIAYSNDRGRTWTDAPGNPVVKHEGRDPKVIWHEPTGSWVMAVYDERDGKKGIAFHTSSDLKAWTFQSWIEGFFECPELFELSIDGAPGQTRWIVYSGSGDYSVGAFDGRTFVQESGKHRFHFGNCFYASQTFNNIPVADGRRIQIAWGQIGHPDMPFNQMMDFPVQLILRDTAEGLRLFAEPVREIELLRTTKHAMEGIQIRPGENPLQNIQGELFQIIAVFKPEKAARLGLTVRGVPIEYDVAKRELFCLNNQGPLSPEQGKIRLEVLVDRTSIEIFGNHGRLYMPVGTILNQADRSLVAFCEGGDAILESLEAYELGSAWDRGPM